MMLYELHKLFKLIWQKKKMLWLQIMQIFFLHWGLLFSWFGNLWICVTDVIYASNLSSI